MKQTEPYSPWQNAAENAIDQIRKGAVASAPAKLLDHCLELEAFIRSDTALDLFALNGQVPETIMSGQTADISQIAEFAWYDWINYFDVQAQFSVPKEQLERWLGPATAVGPAMTSKVLKKNGQTVYVSTYHPLTFDELNDLKGKVEMEEIDKAIEGKLGKPFTTRKVPEAASMPEYLLYAVDIEGTHTHTPDIDDVTPEYDNNYVAVEVTLTFNGKQTAGKVIRRAWDVDGDVKGKAHDNPILDTQMYVVEFPNGSKAEYTANVIAENMFAQCDPEGNQYRLMDEIVVYKKGKAAIGYADQMTTLRRQKYR